MSDLPLKPSGYTSRRSDKESVEGSERKMSNDEQLRRAQEEEEDVVSLGQEPESEEELELSDSEAEEELGSTPLITACRKGMTEVCCECMRERGGGFAYCCV